MINPEPNIDPECGQPGTIKFYDPINDQPGIYLSLIWHDMINLFLHGRETLGM